MSSALTIMDLALNSNPRDRLRIYTPPTSDVSILQPSTEYQYHFEPQWVAIMPRGVARQPILISPTPRDVVHRLSPTDFTSHRHCFFPSTDQLDVWLSAPLNVFARSVSSQNARSSRPRGLLIATKLWPVFFVSKSYCAAGDILEVLSVVWHCELLTRLGCLVVFT